MKAIALTAMRIAILGAFISSTALALHLHHQAVRPILQAGESVTFTIESGVTYRQVMRMLREQNLVDNEYYLWLFSKYLDAERRIKAGTYLLEGPIGTYALLERMIDGYGKVQQKHVLLEGWTIREMIDSMAASGIIEVVDAPWKAMGFDSPEDMEGRCMPDTYHFDRGAKMTDIFAMCVAAMDATLEELWAARADNLPYRSAHDALILASIVESETNLDDERSLVAGVMVKRLQDRIQLQADPTVIYGLGADIDNNLTRAHLQQDPSVNPYNTYQMYGLPPGPIANPGRKSLIAAMHPDLAAGFLYFVSKGDGSHHFSQTYKEHNRAVQKYQLGR